MNEQKNILIVDDDKEYVQRTKTFLEAQDFFVTIAYDGEEALEKIKLDQPDLILLDIMMPKLTGLGFYDRVTPAHSEPLYPIIVITVRANLKELFDNLPIEGFILKPVDYPALLQKIREVFARRKKELKKAGADMKVFKHVLIIEDDFDTAKRIAMPFLEHGYTVTTVKNVREAIERIIDPDMPNLILIRQGLPGYPEFTLSYHLRGIPAARGVSCVVYTKDMNKLSVDVEKEIISFVGKNNLLEFVDEDFLFKRCERILEAKA